MIMKCSVCGRERISKLINESLWKSDFIMALNDREAMRFTVCPHCRQDSFNSILIRINERAMKKAKA